MDSNQMKYVGNCMEIWVRVFLLGKRLFLPNAVPYNLSDESLKLLYFGR